jgi:hypothetical protein
MFRVQKTSKNTEPNSDPIINLRCASALLFEIASKDNAQDVKILGMAKTLIDTARQQIESG